MIGENIDLLKVEVIMMGPWFYGYGGWWGWLVMAMMMLLPILVISIFLYLAFRSFRKPDGAVGLGERPSPLEIVQARYARGEIGQDEYRKMREDLKS